MTPATQYTERNLNMAVMLIAGKNQTDIAKEFGLSQQAVSKALRSDESVKYLIDTSTRMLATMLPKVTANYDRLLSSADDNIVLKANQDILKNTGITPSHTQSITINNIMQTTNIMADPEVMRALQQALAPAGDVIDIEVSS